MNSAENKTVAPGEFVTTRWSLILSGAGSGSGDREIRQALAELCQIYWRPIFLFIARRGYSREDAEDLTQDFFVRILKEDWLQKADPARGRFRSLLLKSLQNFLNDAVDRRNSRKRGGDISFISWDSWIAEAPSQLSLTDEALRSWPAERVFDASWAATMVQRALRGLCEECESKGRRRVFEVLSPYFERGAGRSLVCDVGDETSCSRKLRKKIDLPHAATLSRFVAPRGASDGSRPCRGG